MRELEKEKVTGRGLAKEGKMKKGKVIENV